MLSTLRSVALQKPPARHTLINLYTTVANLTRTHWKTGAHPAPNPLSKDEDEDWPRPQTESVEPTINDTNKSPLPRSHRSFPQKPQFRPTPSEYVAHRATMKKKFPDGWAPPRKVSREAMEKLRELHQLDPRMFSTPILADKFHISKEAVRRILKSKWQPTREEKARLAERERQARLQWRTERRAKEKRMHEEMQEEYQIEPEDRKGDRLSLT